MNHRWSLALAAACTALLVSSCSDPNSGEPDMFYYGIPVTIGSEGTAKAYLRVNSVNYTEAVGVVLSKSALATLPDESVEYTLALPPEAVVAGYTHIGLNWEPAGHGPGGVYDVPHFDVHFYHITPTQRDNIDPSDSAKVAAMPSADEVAANYVRPPGPVVCVPRMGVHWIDTTSKELHGQPFTHTLIYGYWNGDMVFTEPMIAKSLLDAGTAVDVAMKMPKQMPRSGTLYGTSYRIAHDATAGDIHITLENMVRK